MNKNDGQNGIVTWQSPSNIALIKYWGKKGFQLPANPSLSITLSSSFTETSVLYTPVKKGAGTLREFTFEGSPHPIFKIKIQQFLGTIRNRLKFLEFYDLSISSKNTFPHSAGIASSASAMSALALCLCSIEYQLANKERETEDFFRNASLIARIGSGSASRSLYGKFVLWGESKNINQSSDEYAIPLQTTIHPVFENFRDTILIVSSGEKPVSSRAGHALMQNNPFAEARYLQAKNNLSELLKAIASGDLDTFIEITENEALTLHGMMMASKPGYTLMEPNTLEILQRIKQFREQTNAKVCFTLDAGPNVHLLYPATDALKVKNFIDKELEKYCSNQQVIDDKMGTGPKRIFDHE
jgi:diphosphomevalonate decarboxylase